MPLYIKDNLHQFWISISSFPGQCEEQITSGDLAFLTACFIFYCGSKYTVYNYIIMHTNTQIHSQFKCIVTPNSEMQVFLSQIYINELLYIIKT